MAELLEVVASKPSDAACASGPEAEQLPEAPTHPQVDGLDENIKYVQALEAITEEDFMIEGYECWPAIKMEMSV